MRNVGIMLLLSFAVSACETATEPAGRPDPFSGGPVFGAQPTLVPFSDRATLHAAPGTASLPCEPAAFGVTMPQVFEAEGTSTHLGKTVTTITHETCTLDVTGASAFSTTGTFVKTAANGDELWGSFTGTFYLDGELVLTSLVFSGGTGRFANAAGTATGKGFINLATFIGYYSTSGMISRPGV